MYLAYFSFLNIQKNQKIIILSNILFQLIDSKHLNNT
jgi:hypothetical protein